MDSRVFFDGISILLLRLLLFPAAGAPCRQKALQIWEASGVAPMSNMMKQTSAYAIGLGPSAGKELLEIMRRTRPQRQAPTV
jgi:precorrin isomerase